MNINNEIDSYNEDFVKQIEEFIQFYKKFHDDIVDHSNSNQNRQSIKNIAVLKISLLNDSKNLSQSNKKKFNDWIKNFLSYDEKIQKYLNNKINKNTINFHIYLMTLQISTLLLFVKKKKLSSSAILNEFLIHYNSKLKAQSKLLNGQDDQEDE